MRKKIHTQSLLEDSAEQVNQRRNGLRVGETDSLVEGREKTCSGCGKRKPINQFYPRPSNRDGFHGQCKICLNADRERWAIENKEKVDYNRIKWLVNNPEKRKETLRRYRASHPNQVSDWEAANRERSRAIKRRWEKKNPESIRANNTNRQAKIRGAGGSFKKWEVQKLIRKQEWKCAACQDHLYGKYHADHIIPVAKGGSNYISNIQILCPPCNYLKSDKMPEEFLKRLYQKRPELIRRTKRNIMKSVTYLPPQPQ